MALPFSYKQAKQELWQSACRDCAGYAAGRKRVLVALCALVAAWLAYLLPCNQIISLTFYWWMSTWRAVQIYLLAGNTLCVLLAALAIYKGWGGLMLFAAAVLLGCFLGGTNAEEWTVAFTPEVRVAAICCMVVTAAVGVFLLVDKPAKIFYDCRQRYREGCAHLRRTFR